MDSVEIEFALVPDDFVAFSRFVARRESAKQPRIHKVREIPGGTVEVQLHGIPSDAEYVRKALANHNGIHTTEPKPVSGAVGVLMSFRAKGTEASVLTKDNAPYGH